MSILQFLQPDSPDGGRKRALPSAVPATVGSLYEMPLDRLGTGGAAAHMKRLTMCPVDPFGGAEPFEAFQRDADHLRVPRFYGVAAWGPAERDQTADGDPVPLRFEGGLSEVQLAATAAYEARLAAAPTGPAGGIVVLPCGYGKTVFALHMAARLGRRTLVLVHKSFLLEQWQARARQFLPGASLGVVQQGLAETQADVVVGMVQSIAKREYPPGTFDGFGFVVVDEAHHMAARVFSQALRRLPARRVLGLSATPERADKMDDLLRWSMGDICFRVQRKAEVVHVHAHAFEEAPRPKPILTRDGRPNLAVMLNRLAKNPRRNALLAARVAAYAAEGRRVIVMGDRIDQLHAIDTLLQARAPAVSRGFYIGKTPPAERAAAEERDVILTTYSMSREALDIPALDTLVMATPVGNVEQVIGRILRAHPGKQTPAVFDLLDQYQPFEAMRRKRGALYAKEKYCVEQVTDQGAASSSPRSQTL